MSYSQMLNVARIDNRCAKCERVFAKWSEYHTHVVTIGCIGIQYTMPGITKRNLLGVKEPLSEARKSEVIAKWEARQKQGAII